MAILLSHYAVKDVSVPVLIACGDATNSCSVYHAHETTAVEPFAIALLCGDVRCDVCIPPSQLPKLSSVSDLHQMFSGVIVLDGNRGRFALPDWKTMLVLKVLRTRLRELLTRSFKQPGKLPTAQQEKWLEVWQKLFTQDQRDDGKSSVVSVAVAKA